MHCKYLKLINGDNIIVQTDDPCTELTKKDSINVVDPVLLRSMHLPRGLVVYETYIMQPWIKVAKKDVINIPTRNIVAAVDVHDIAVEQYKQYLNEIKDVSMQISSSEETGEIINEGDETFEQFMQMLSSEQEEDENDDEHPRSTSGRTIH